MIQWKCTLFTKLYINISFHWLTSITVRLNLPEPSEQEKNGHLQEDRRTIKSALDKCLPPVIGPEELQTVHDASKNDTLKFKTLISLRRSHQRKQAQTGIRRNLLQANQKKNTSDVPTIQPGSSSESDNPQLALTPPTQSAPEVKQSRRDLLRGFQAVIKAQEERGVATAVGRKVRWESRQPGRQSAAADSETGTATGNSGNALQVAENEAKKVRLYY